MTYTLIYNPRVVKDDIPKLGSQKERVKRAVFSKLTTKPELFGYPLVGSLKGYRKLRVGEYRVIFRIEGSSILIDKIGHRSKVYKEAVKRLIKRL